MRKSRPWLAHLGLKPLPRSQRSLTKCIHCSAKLIIPRASFSRASPVTKRHTSLWYCKSYTTILYKHTTPPRNCTFHLCLWLSESIIPSKVQPGYQAEYSTPSSTKVKNKWSWALLPLDTLMARIATTLPFISGKEVTCVESWTGCVNTYGEKEGWKQEQLRHFL